MSHRDKICDWRKTGSDFFCLFLPLEGINSFDIPNLLTHVLLHHHCVYSAAMCCVIRLPPRFHNRAGLREQFRGDASMLFLQPGMATVARGKGTLFAWHIVVF